IDLDDRTDGALAAGRALARALLGARLRPTHRLILKSREIGAIERPLLVDAASTASGSFDGMTTHQIDMLQVARRVVQDNGFLTDMPPGLVATIPAKDPDEGPKDLRALAWSSIDNEESRDL